MFTTEVNDSFEKKDLYDCCGGSRKDVHQLDQDGDSVVCETLPKDFINYGHMTLFY